jgi:hypothetical protein
MDVNEIHPHKDLTEKIIGVRSTLTRDDIDCAA